MRHLKSYILAIGIAALIVILHLISTIELREVQSGESELWCHLHKGYQMIDPDNVSGLHSNGKWLFKDGGSARSCEVVKK